MYATLKNHETQQQHLNFGWASLYFVVEADLQLLFRRYWRALPEAERTAAIASQQRWLAYREKQADQAASVYEGGTLAPLMHAQTMVELTRARLTELETQLRALGHDPYDPPAAEPAAAPLPEK